jgi:hypothetical protein
MLALLSVPVYLIARGGSMHERQASAAQAQAYRAFTTTPRARTGASASPLICVIAASPRGRLCTASRCSPRQVPCRKLSDAQ